MYGHEQHTVVVDATVLHPRTLREWLPMIALSRRGEVHRVRWSEDVPSETLHRPRRDHPHGDGRRIESVRTSLEKPFAEYKVTGVPIDPSCDGPDPNDAPVHSAAVACGADIPLTSDKRLTRWTLDNDDELPYEVRDPDDLFCFVDTCAPYIVEEVVRDQSASWAERRGDAPLVQHLGDAGATEFAERVQAHVPRIALHG